MTEPLGSDRPFHVNDKGKERHAEATMGGMREGGREGERMRRRRMASVKSHETVVNLKCGVPPCGLRGREGSMAGVPRWSGSRRGSSSCQWGRPGAQWAPGWPGPRPRWWGSTCRLRPADTPRLENRGQQERVHNGDEGTDTLPDFGCGTYLRWNDLHSGQMAAPAPGRCWWVEPESRWGFASRGTCTSVPRSRAGNRGFGSGQRNPLQRGTEEAVETLQVEHRGQTRVIQVDASFFFSRRFRVQTEVYANCKKKKRLLIMEASMTFSFC